MATQITIRQNSVGTSGATWFCDVNGQNLKLKNVGTTVEVVIAYGSKWNKLKADWAIQLHAGLLFKNNVFLVDEREYSYCLVHTLPCKDSPCKIEAKVSNDLYELHNILKSWIGISKDYARIYSIDAGKSTRPIDAIVGDVTKILEWQFILSSIKQKLLENTYPLLTSGQTNSLHSPLVMLNALHTNYTAPTFEELLIDCYTRAVEDVFDRRSMHGIDEPDWGKLLQYTAKVSSYDKGVSYSVRERAHKLHQRAETET